MTELRITAPGGIGEIEEGCDLVGLVLGVARLADGDVLVVTSKILSKAEGQVRPGADRDEAIDEETVRVVARRGPVRIVENHLGLVMAAAGVDNSNLPVGTIALLPRDPDASARSLREALMRRGGVNVAVVVSDTSGRAWRLGQTDIAIGAAGIPPLDSFAGTTDSYGNALAVTQPAIADEIAAAAELASGKLGGRPLCIVRGLGDRVLAVGEHGPGARAVVRPRAGDMFALGCRESVTAALLGEPDSFGAPAQAREVRAVLDRLGIAADLADDTIAVAMTGGADPVRIELVAISHGWVVETTPAGCVLRPGPGDLAP